MSAETDRALAFGSQLRSVHQRLRRSMALARRSVDGEVDIPEGMDLLVYCRGFCAALGGHHRGEDAALFPQIAAERPELRPVIDDLVRDHNMIDHLLGSFAAALESDAGPGELHRHLDGIEAVMENHFRYEERRLSHVLDQIALSGDAPALLGDLAAD